MKNVVALSGIAAMSVASAAFADNFTFNTGGGVSIPDGNLAGVSIATNAGVGQAGQQVGTLSLNLNVDHTWVGDLIVQLTYTPTVGAPVTFDIFNRVGRVTSGFGDSSNLSVANALVFNDSGGDLWAAAAAVGDAVNIAAGVYRTSSANSATATNLSAAFAGMDGTGTWSLLVIDTEAADVGRIASASIDVTYVPAPGAAAVLGLGGLMARRRRR